MNQLSINRLSSLNLPSFALIGDTGAGPCYHISFAIQQNGNLVSRGHYKQKGILILELCPCSHSMAANSDSLALATSLSANEFLSSGVPETQWHTSKFC